jgi:hypothetical protein
MSLLTYRDIPLLRAAGFVPGEWGHSYFGKDKHGTEWQVALDDYEDSLWFTSHGRHTTKFTRSQFENNFMKDKTSL